MESGFIQISKSAGIKLFTRQANRDHSFYGQYYASKKGLAPAVGQRFCLSVPTREEWSDESLKQIKVYGYFTQVADNVGRRHPTTAFCNKLKKAGLTTWDLHKGNVGTIGNRMVCIDFGPVSQKKKWKNKVNPKNK